MANFMKYATAAAVGYAMRAYSQRKSATSVKPDSPIPGLITGYLVERIFNSLWPQQKQAPQTYRKVPFTDHYVPVEEPNGGFYGVYKNFRKKF